MRRVRVAALRVDGEGCRASLLGGERPEEEGEVIAVRFSCGILRERLVETKAGRGIIVGDEWRRTRWGSGKAA